LILAIFTAVNVVATDGRTTPAALLDGYRAALIAPLVAVVAALAITATGLRTRRTGEDLRTTPLTADGAERLFSRQEAHVTGYWINTFREVATVIEFESTAAAIAAYESEAYRHALGVPGDAAVRDIRIINGES